MISHSLGEQSSALNLLVAPSAAAAGDSAVIITPVPSKHAWGEMHTASPLQVDKQDSKDE